MWRLWSKAKETAQVAHTAPNPMPLGAIEEYIRQVEAQVKATEMHGQIRAELYDHMMSRVEEDMAAGVPRERAEYDAVEQMGDPSSTAKQFNDVHKLRWPWLLWMVFIVWVGIGFVGFLIYLISPSRLSYLDLTAGYRQGIILVLGFAFLVMMCLVDYRKWLKSGDKLFYLTLLIMLGVQLSGHRINGRSSFHLASIELDIIGLSPFILLIGLYLWHSKRPHQIRQQFQDLKDWGMMLISLLPLMIFMKEMRLFSILIYSIGLLLLYTVWLKMSWHKIAGVFGLLIIASAMLFTVSDYAGSRVTNWIQFLQSGAGDNSYAYGQIHETIIGAGWFGHGIMVPLDISYLFPNHLLLFVIHTFGWAGGICVMALFVMLIRVMFQAAAQVKQRTGRQLMQLGATYMLLHAVIYLLGLFSIIPLNSEAMPLMSYGFDSMILWMFILGLFCNIYIRKDVTPVSEVDA